MARWITVFALACLPMCLVASRAVSGGSKKAQADLKVGVLLDSSPTKVMFSVTNHGTQSIFTSELGINNNRPTFITPDGKESEDVVFERLPRGVGAVTGEPGQTKNWELAIAGAMQRRKLQVPGWYGLYWSFEGAKSKTVWFYKAATETMQE